MSLSEMAIASKDMHRELKSPENECMEEMLRILLNVTMTDGRSGTNRSLQRYSQSCAGPHICGKGLAYQ